MAKAVLGLTTTVGRIGRLTIDRALRRIRGFALCRKLPSETNFSRALDEIAEAGLGQRVHEALITAHLGEDMIGHLSRDGIAIEARERPPRTATKSAEAVVTAQASVPPAEALATEAQAPETAVPAKKRGHPRRGEARPQAKVTLIQPGSADPDENARRDSHRG